MYSVLAPPATSSGKALVKSDRFQSIRNISDVTPVGDIGVYRGIVYGGIVYGGIVYGGIVYGGIVYGGIVNGCIVYGGIVYGGIVYGGIGGYL